MFPNGSASGVSGGIGVAGVLITLLAFCKRLQAKFPVDSQWFPIIAIATLQIPSFRWTQNLAKNDHGIAFWGLSAFYASFYLAPISPGLAFFTGALAGAAAVGKVHSCHPRCCIGLNILFTSRKHVLPFILGGLAGSAPVFLRNYFLTDNPVFPWLPKIFPSPVINEFLEHGAAAATSKAFHLVDLPYYLNEFYAESYFLISIILILFFRKTHQRCIESDDLPILSFFVFTVTVRPSTGIRYQGPTLFLLVFFGTYFSFFVLNKLFTPLLKNKKILFSEQLL
jgi:hypothetical protein